MPLLLGFAFLSGLVTILAPCIWPLLPIVLSSSAAGKNHIRPLGITLGIMLSFTIFTLAISFLVKMFHLDPNIVRLFAVVVLVIMGLSMIIPALSQIIEVGVSKLSGTFGQTQQTKTTDFQGGFITGLSLGVVWSPCAGPILASIAALAVTGQVTINVFLVTLAYVLGVGIPLFAFAYGGQKVINRTKFISAYTGRIQQVFGVIMLLTALAIYTNYDKTIQLKLLNALPGYTQLLTGFEKSSIVRQQLDALKGKTSLQSTDTSGLFNANTQAPEFVGITKWLNTDRPLSLSGLRGKVVLVDFWTYTCINCIRSLPFVTNWYDKYKDQGFVVVGVHTPEFEFEKDTNNVLSAIKQYNIHYPVAQDNNYATWNAYNNQYWPAEYLIDKDGVIRRTHFGEGEYDKTEMAIQTLLRQAGQQVGNKLEQLPDQTPRMRLSPETYLGSKRMEFYYPTGNLLPVNKTFTLSKNLSQNSFSLGGEWTITSENAVSGKNASLNYNFYANKVFLVLRPGTAGKNAKARIFLDGNPLNESNSGDDVKDGIIIIDSDRLYNLIDLKGNNGYHILLLEFLTPGIEAFAFTFG